MNFYVTGPVFSNIAGSQSFSYKKNLFNCEKCNKGYNSLEGYKLHKRVYCGMKPKHQCPECSHLFYQFGHMRTHMSVVHNIVVPYIRRKINIAELVKNIP